MRHPIYTAVLSLTLAALILAGTWWSWAWGVVIFVVLLEQVTLGGQTPCSGIRGGVGGVGPANRASFLAVEDPLHDGAGSASHPQVFIP